MRSVGDSIHASGIELTDMQDSLLPLKLGIIVTSSAVAKNSISSQLNIGPSMPAKEP